MWSVVVLPLVLTRTGRRIVVAAVPGGPGVQGLEAVAVGIDGYLDSAAVVGRGDVAGLAGVEPGGGHLGGLAGGIEPVGGAIGSGELVGEGVE